nr:TlpA disulfide reductase family protein [uncultured Carboxylicivirga sp.]
MKVFLYILIFALLISCDQPKRTPYLTYSSNSDTISNVELYHFTHDFVLFDTATKEKESNIWAFRSDSVPQGIYQLKVNNNTPLTILLEGTLPVSIEKNKGKLHISGNEPTKDLWEAQNIADKLNRTITELGQSFPDSIESSAFIHHKDSVFSLIKSFKEKAQQQISNIINHNKSNLLPLLLVQLKAGNHHIFDYNSDANMYFTVADYLQSYNPNSIPVRDFNNRVDSLRSWVYYTSVTLPGKQLPDINVPNAWGDPIPLSRFKGKNTLFLIWNSESDECRKITKILTKWSRPYRLKGLDLCLISTDTNKDNWQTAINEDNLPFWHLSDLEGKHSPVLAGLGITKIPTFILINKEGIILERSSNQADISKTLNHLIQK